MTDFLVYVFAYFWVYYKAWIVVAYIISRLIFIAYLYFNCYDKPWVASIPFGHCFAKRELSGVNIVLIVVYVASVILFILMFSWVWFLVMWAMSMVINYHFSKIYVDEHNPAIFAFIPFAKVIIMIRDIVRYAKHEGEENEIISGGIYEGNESR